MKINYFYILSPVRLKASSPQVDNDAKFIISQNFIVASIWTIGLLFCLAFLNFFFKGHSKVCGMRHFWSIFWGIRLSSQNSKKRMNYLKPQTAASISALCRSWIFCQCFYQNNFPTIQKKIRPIWIFLPRILQDLKKFSCEKSMMPILSTTNWITHQATSFNPRNNHTGVNLV